IEPSHARRRLLTLWGDGGIKFPSGSCVEASRNWTICRVCDTASIFESFVKAMAPWVTDDSSRRYSLTGVQSPTDQIEKRSTPANPSQSPSGLKQTTEVPAFNRATSSPVCPL